MKKRKLIIIFTMISMLLCGCSGNSSGSLGNLMEEIQPQKVEPVLVEGAAEAVNDFSVKLLQSSVMEEKGKLISPVSVMAALGMTANGAKGETYAQMEDVLGLSAEELNNWFYGYEESLPKQQELAVHLANSIWFRDDEAFRVERDFLQSNADYYGAAAYRVPFDDGTVKDINSWVRDNTNQMIDSIIDRMPDEAVLYLINAVSFEARWQDIYEENQIREGIFTSSDGEERTVDFMYSTEYGYLQDECAGGFLKPYKDGRFAFMGLLPDERVSVEEYVQGLTGSRLHDMLCDVSDEKVIASIPKFEWEYSAELGENLRTMGMPAAFEQSAADFSGMGGYQGQNLYIGKVIHKTKITVDEWGTKAGAATAVEMDAGGAEMEPPKMVYLDRPFVYGIIDLETNTPLFLGILTDVG